MLDKNSSASLQIVVNALEGTTFCCQGVLDQPHSGCNRSCEEQCRIVPSPPPPNINYLIGIALQSLPASSTQAAHWRPVECNLVARSHCEKWLFQ